MVYAKVSMESEERTRSESPHVNMDTTVSEFDPSKLLERCQSDGTLLSSNSQQLKQSMQQRFSKCESQQRKEKHTKVSESSKVYFDLSNIDSSNSESITNKESFTNMGCRENTVVQGSSVEKFSKDEEISVSRRLSGQKLTFSHSSERLSETESESNIESEIEEQTVSFCTKYPLVIPKSMSSDANQSLLNQTSLKLSYQRLSQELEEHIKPLKHSSSKQEVRHLKRILDILLEAWAVPIFGRDLAYGLCDVIRNEGVLDMVCNNCTSSNKEVLHASAALLEQSLSLENRNYVAQNFLETIVGMTHEQMNNHEMAYTITGVLEGLFKISEEASTKIVNLGGLDVILHWSRSSEVRVLRHCARAISNLSLFGGADNQEEMARRNVPEWLFPLAFMEDDTIRYYACLAIAVLVANKELEAAVMKSGTLDLVMPFITSTKPSTFAKSDASHKQGRDRIWLERLVPLLFSRREEAQALAAFHFAMEAGIKEEQGRLGVFYDSGAIEPLKKVASSPNATASKLAAQALKVIGESIPHKLTPQVPVWSTADVAHWVAMVGFKDYEDKFQHCQVDGDLLLLMTEEDLKDSICMNCKISRKRFLRELKALKVTADYSSCDPTQMDSWLMKILPDLSQYTYNMLKCGMNKDLLASTTPEELESVCDIKNGIHRRLILEHIEDLYTQLTLPKYGSIGSLTRQKSIDPTGFASYPKAVDVFISYRRSNGSQLASLLKVHLQLRGFSVFLDIDRLRAGKFDENLLMNIRLSRHFLLVLTPNALERCKGDYEQQDWIHKEIVTALESECNIIPVLDDFEWPLPETLPTDMQQVVYFNGVRWVHDYQDACVDKIEKFLSGEKVTEKTPSQGAVPGINSERSTSIQFGPAGSSDRSSTGSRNSTEKLLLALENGK